jgi:hypothetical protein
MDTDCSKKNLNYCYVEHNLFLNLGTVPLWTATKAQPIKISNQVFVTLKSEFGLYHYFKFISILAFTEELQQDPGSWAASMQAQSKWFFFLMPKWAHLS